MTAKWIAPFKLLGVVGLLGITGYLTLEVLAQSASAQDIAQPTEQSMPIIPDHAEDEHINGVQERGISQRHSSGGIPLKEVVPMDQKFRGKKPGAMGTVNIVEPTVVNTTEDRELNRIRGILQGADKNLNGNTKIPKKQQSPLEKTR